LCPCRPSFRLMSSPRPSVRSSHQAVCWIFMKFVAVVLYKT
jgi:hypothetical protein